MQKTTGLAGIFFGNPKVLGSALSLGLPVLLLSRFILLPHPGKFQIELIAGDFAGEEALHQLSDSDLYGK